MIHTYFAVSMIFSLYIHTHTGNFRAHNRCKTHMVCKARYSACDYTGLSVCLNKTRAWLITMNYIHGNYFTNVDVLVRCLRLRRATLCAFSILAPFWAKKTLARASRSFPPRFQLVKERALCVGSRIHTKSNVKSAGANYFFPGNKSVPRE